MALNRTGIKPLNLLYFINVLLAFGSFPGHQNEFYEADMITENCPFCGTLKSQETKTPK